MPASAAGAGDESVLLDPERVRELEGFDRRVAGVRHVGVDARHSGPVRERALATCDGLVVRERPRIGSADRQIVHRALALGGDRVGEGLREREEQDIDDSLRGLDIPGGDRGRRTRRNEAPLPRQHAEGSERAGVSRCVGVGQASHHIGGRTQRHGEWRVQIPRDLAIGSREVHGDPGTANCDLRADSDSLGFVGRRPFQEIFRGPRSARELADRGAHPPLSVIEELVDPASETRDPDS